MLKASEVRELTVEELVNRIEEIRKELIELRFKHRMGTLDNPLILRNKRRELAMLLTVQNDATSGKIPLKTQT